MPEADLLAAKLQAKGERLAAFMEGLTEHQWRTAVYSDSEGWTIAGVFGHVLASENDYLALFAQVRGGGPGVREGFDIDGHNARQLQKTGALDGSALIREFRAARARMVDFVSGLSDVDLDTRGRHPYLGVVPLREMIKLVYVHNESHFRDVRRILTNG